MKHLTIYRSPSTQNGTFGMMLDEEIPFCLTVERPWLNNEKNRSCIPVGEYICKRVMSPNFGDTFEVCDVPGRTLIRFHKGNIMDDSHGCVVVGEQFEYLKGKPAVLASGKAFSEFHERLKGINEFKLSIIWAGGDP